MDAVADYFLQANPNYHLRTGNSIEARERVRQMIRGLNPLGFAHTIRAMWRAYFPTQRLAQITAPTLVLAGEHDPALEAVRLTHRTIPGATLQLIPDAGHLSNLDQPEAFQNRILHFLRGIEVDSGV
ncbi:MAG: alpha/beta hydrolase [Candidatus Tectomicrobia bacterium]|nr:alpha/beta hydrolase [Candidatus Tectomicrobia bacterium]